MDAKVSENDREREKGRREEWEKREEEGEGG